jgi:hypothetical protein
MTDLVILTTASVYIGLPIREVRMVHLSAQNASNFTVYDAQFWYSGDPGGLSSPDDIGTIMPDPAGLNGGQMRYDQAVEHAILTFRDAESARWIRIACGDLEEKTPMARDSVLAALGQSLGSHCPSPDRQSRPRRSRHPRRQRHSGGTEISQPSGGSS